MKLFRQDLILYAVTDRRWLGDRTLYHVVKEALEGGVTMVQLREKDLDHEAFKAEAQKIQSLCMDFDVPFIINDNVQLAIELHADGVHVGQSDMEAGTVRKMIGPDKILGVSVGTPEEAVLAQSQGADYLGAGAVFPTGSKSDAIDVSYETLKQICGAVNIPVVAIGGINLDNIVELAGSKIAGVAVISAIFASENIKEAALNLFSFSQDLFYLND